MSSCTDAVYTTSTLLFDSFILSLRSSADFRSIEDADSRRWIHPR